MVWVYRKQRYSAGLRAEVVPPDAVAKRLSLTGAAQRLRSVRLLAESNDFGLEFRAGTGKMCTPSTAAILFFVISCRSKRAEISKHSAPRAGVISTNALQMKQQDALRVSQLSPYVTAPKTTVKELIPRYSAPVALHNTESLCQKLEDGHFGRRPSAGSLADPGEGRRPPGTSRFGVVPVTAAVPIVLLNCSNYPRTAPQLMRSVPKSRSA